MCLPIKFLKFVVRMNAIITILVGIMALVTGIIVGYKTTGSAKQFFQTAGQSSGDELVAGLYIFGIVTILVGMMGWYGGYKKNKCLLAIYNLGNLIFVIAFHSAAVDVFIRSDRYVDLTKDECIKQKWSLSIYQISEGANENFCTSQCPCYINTSLFPPYYFENTLLNYTDNPQDPTNYADCPNFDQLPSNSTNSGSYDLMRIAENYFECAGWCTRSDFYQFTNTNNGKPGLKPCFQKVTRWISYYGQTVGSICFTVASFLFLSLIFTSCLCLHPKKKSQKSMYDRMAYYDDDDD